MNKQAKIARDKVFRKIGKANQSYDLINEGDKILMALSGGVDSFVLLDSIASRLKYLPIHYTVHAIHVQVENLPIETDVNAIQTICDNLEIPLHIEKTTVFNHKGNNKSTCFPCSWQKRKVIFKKAKELNFNKVAFGHHLDDSLETLMMNMVHHAEISSIPPKVYMKKGDIELIRPLILLSEDEVKAYAEAQKIYKAEKECPFEDRSQRKRFKEIISTIGNMDKSAKLNMFNSMSKIITEYLPPGRKSNRYD
jgi:tRNA(Ile)-lysidine synthetase-like protein